MSADNQSAAAKVDRPRSTLTPWNGAIDHCYSGFDRFVERYTERVWADCSAPRLVIGEGCVRILVPNLDREQ